MSIFEELRRFWARRESIKAGAPPMFRLLADPPPAPTPTVIPPDPPPLENLALHAMPQIEPGRGGYWRLPKHKAQVVECFGDPGVNREKVDPKWERENLVIVEDLPGAWNSGKGRLYMHFKAAIYFREALSRCKSLGVLDYIERVGCFNFRHMRHDPRMPLSRHAWGVAVDINSDDNAGKYLKSPPRPFSPAWWAIYPSGVPELLVRAFESAGWTWGGRWRGYCDPMHFQLGA